MSNIIDKEGYYSGIRQDILKIVPKKDFQTILEIGGGEFNTLNHLCEKHGAKGTAVDIVNLCKHPLEFINGSIEDPEIVLTLRKKKYDLILALDVLEHLSTPYAAIDNLFSITKKNGYLILSVPNIRQIRAFYNIYIKGSFPAQKSGLFDKTHLHWFCKKDISDLLKNAGYEVELIYNQGRYIPDMLNKTVIAELLGLHTIVLAKKL